jgi:hypothetical protein
MAQLNSRHRATPSSAVPAWTPNPARANEQRPEAHQKSVDGRQIRCALSTAVEDQQLAPEQKVLSHHGPGTTRPEDLGDGGQKAKMK